MSPENLEDFDAVIFHIRDMNDGEMPVPNQALSNLLNFLSIFLKSISYCVKFRIGLMN